jgi:hypothetical protein
VLAEKVGRVVFAWQMEDRNTQQIHFRGVTLHLLARIIVSLPASAEIE